MDFILDRAIHGQRCALGELFLTEDELQRVNTIIAASGFRFIRQSAVSQQTQAITATSGPPQNIKSTHLDDPVSNPITASNVAKEATTNAPVTNAAGSGGGALPTGGSGSTTAAAPGGGGGGGSAGGTSQTQKSTTARQAKRPTRPSALPASKETPPRPSVKLVSPTAKRRPNTRRLPPTATPIDDSSSEVLGDSTHPRKRKKVASVPELGKSIATASATAPPPPTPTPLPVLITPTLIKETPKRPPIIEIKGDGAGVWEAACAAVCDIIENDPHAKYFLQPVNPEADGLPEYFKKVQNPMDLHTVRQKLEGKLYTHPFRWQHDVRNIFFNAFTYFEEGSPIWRSAAELAVTFENLCKENIGVNPYAVYRMEAPPPPLPLAPPPASSATAVPTTIPTQHPAVRSGCVETVLAPGALGAASLPISQLTSTESGGDPAGTLYSQAMPGNGIMATAVSGAVDTSSNIAPPLLVPPSREVSTGADMIYADHPAPEERVVTDVSVPPSITGPSASPAHVVATHHTAAPPLPSQGSVSASGTGVAPPTSSHQATTGGKKGRPVPPKGVRFREGFGVVYTAECNGTPFEREMSRNPPVSALPPPCPVPAAQMTESKSPLIPTAAQKKSTLGRFKELDVTYRKAVLDLVKNELGINSLLCALDSRYIPEVDVLPHLKQRQFLLFMKALVTQQKLAQDAHHLPATLPRILNWNTSAHTASETTQSMPQQEVQATKRRTFLDKMAGSSPVDASPWVVSGAAVKNKSKSTSSSSSSSESDSSEGGSDSDSSSASSVYRSVPAAPTPPVSRPPPEKKSAVVAPPTRVPRPTPTQFPPPYLQSMQPRPMAFGSGKVLPMPGMSGPYGPPRPFIPMQFAAFSSGMAPGGMAAGGMNPAAGVPGGGMPPNAMPGMAPGMQRMTPPPMPVVPMGAAPVMMPRMPSHPHPSQDVYRQPPISNQRPRHQRLGLWRPGTRNPNSMPPSAWSMPPQAPTIPNQMNGGTCWGEWKTKVLQETFLSQTRNVGVASERESRAEKADAEI